MGAPAILSACFEADKVELHPNSLIDNFEDADLVPSRGGLVNWYCFSFTDGASASLCNTNSKGPVSTHALSLTYLLDVPSDAPEGSYGFGVGTKPSVGTLDFSTYDQLQFSAKLVPGTPSPPKDRLFAVLLGCNTVQPVSGSTATFWVAYSFAPSGDWTKYGVPLENFLQPTDWQTPMYHPEDCLKLNDSIRFETANSFAGDSEAATLMLDDVYFQ